MIRTIISKQLYQYGNQELEYIIVKSKRRKTSEIIVDEKEIMLRIPSDKSMTDAQNLLASKIKWIIKKQKEYREHTPEIIKPDFSKNSTLPYKGKNYAIQIIKKRNKDDKIALNDKFVITLSIKKRNLDSDDRRIKSLYEDWLYQQSKNIFEEKMKLFGHIINVTPKKLVIKKLKNRWGSVTKEGAINLNCNLMKAREDVIDYVIIHELCHFLIKKHSTHFWNLIKEYVCDYEKKIEWLEVNGKYLLN